MNINTFDALAAVAALSAGAAAAQTSTEHMTGGAEHMTGGAMASDHAMTSGMKMTKAEMKTHKMSAATSHDAMTANAKCKALVAAHPDGMSTGAMSHWRFGLRARQAPGAPYVLEPGGLDPAVSEPG